MPRPTNKDSLLSLSAVNFEKLKQLVSSYSKEELEKEFPEQYMNRNIRDVLAHLHHWHLLMLEWYEVGMAGTQPHMPAKGYTWKTVPSLNKSIREKYSTVKLATIQKLLNESFRQLRLIIESHTDHELFEKKKYKWTGTTSLGACLVSATSSHYDWAFKLIKKCKR